MSPSSKPFVEVSWWDAEDYHTSGWATQEETEDFTKKACLIITRGWLVYRSKHYVSLARDLALTGEPYWGGVIKIPKKMIVGPIVVLPLPGPVGGPTPPASSLDIPPQS